MRPSIWWVNLSSHIRHTHTHAHIAWRFEIIIMIIIACGVAGMHLHFFRCYELRKRTTSIHMYHWPFIIIDLVACSRYFTLHHWQLLCMRYPSATMDEYEFKISQKMEIEIQFYSFIRKTCVSAHSVINFSSNYVLIITLFTSTLNSNLRLQKSARNIRKLIRIKNCNIIGLLFSATFLTFVTLENSFTRSCRSPISQTMQMESILAWIACV